MQVHVAIATGFNVHLVGGYEAILHGCSCSPRLRRHSLCWGPLHDQQATLILFIDWPKETPLGVEVITEVKRQVEYDFGQTQALAHHNAEFDELLDKLPTGSIVSAVGATPTHWSLLELTV